MEEVFKCFEGSENQEAPQDMSEKLAKLSQVTLDKLDQVETKFEEESKDVDDSVDLSTCATEASNTN